MHTLTCAGCHGSFEAKTVRAKWCSSACRKRTQRAAAQAARSERSSTADADPAEDADDSGDAHDLVSSVMRDLEKAKAVDTFNGQLALQLARRMSNPDESGISALSKELRSVMAAALGMPVPSESADKPSAGEDDEVTRARSRREEARQAAGLT